MMLCSLSLAAALQPGTARACAACYGESGSPLAQGMTWGVFSLLGVVGTVLGGIAAFFIYLARRAALHPQPPVPDHEPLMADTEPSVTDLWKNS